MVTRSETLLAKDHYIVFILIEFRRRLFVLFGYFSTIDASVVSFINL